MKETTTSTTITTVAPTTTTEPPEPIRLEGTGDDVLIIDGSIPGAFVLVHAQHHGTSNFVVRSDDDLLVNVIGGYEGITLADGDTETIEIKADGDWSIDISDR